MKVLIVGHGMLGQAMSQHGDVEPTVLEHVPWADPVAARQRLRTGVHAFLAGVEEPHLLCWSAGAGVVGTSSDQLAVERGLLEAFLDAISASPALRPDLTRCFVASSAGGIYATGDGLERDESSPPDPRSAYGENKLLQDEMAAAWATAAGVVTLIGRMSNLYGPQQNLSKPQGFISHLCRAIVRRSAFTLSVPAGTVRDFVYTDDVASRIVLWATERPTQPAQPVMMKLLVNGHAVTLGHVIAKTRAISRAPTRILLGSRPGDAAQPPVLRFRSRVAPHLDEHSPNRTLEQGISATWQAALRSLQCGNRILTVRPVEVVAAATTSRTYTRTP